MKKFIALLLCGILTATALTGCGSSSAGGENGEVIVYNWGPALRSSIRGDTLREYRTVLVLLILAAAATDVLDGRIARSFNSISQVGRILDPVADKAMQGVRT